MNLTKFSFLQIYNSGGHAKTLMFAHVSPEGDSFGETISTLKFAQRVSTVELGAARVNKESNEVMQLKEQVNRSISFTTISKIIIIFAQLFSPFVCSRV